MQDNKNVPYIQNAMTIAFLIVLVIIFDYSAVSVPSVSL